MLNQINRFFSRKLFAGLVAAALLISLYLIIISTHVSRCIKLSDISDRHTNLTFNSPEGKNFCLILGKSRNFQPDSNIAMISLQSSGIFKSFNIDLEDCINNKYLLANDDLDALILNVNKKNGLEDIDDLFGDTKVFLQLELESDPNSYAKYSLWINFVQPIKALWWGRE